MVIGNITYPTEGTKLELHQWVKEDTKKVKLMKMSKGWQWEITYEHTDNEKLLAEIKELNQKLRDEYGEKPEEK